MITTAVEKEIPFNYELVASLLKEGKDNAITSKQIIKQLGWKGNDQRNVFHIVEQLIKNHGYLIGSSRKGEYKGYYLISNDDEYMETMRTYNSQIQSMLNRHRKLQESYLKRDQIIADI